MPGEIKMSTTTAVANYAKRAVEAATTDEKLNNIAKALSSLASVVDSLQREIKKLRPIT
jgi:hypothetical protein